MLNEFATATKMFSTNTDILERTINGVPAEKWLAQPGDDSNHLLWITGHVVVHRAMVLKTLGAEWSAPWEKLFSRGEKRVAADQYPPAAEIQSAWKEVSEKLTAALANASPDALNSPAAKGVPTLDGTVGGTISLLCLHETYHLGQMGYLRKWLGFGQGVG